MKTVLIVLAVSLLVAAAILESADYRWRVRTRALVAALRQDGPRVAPATFSAEQLAALPAPVRRYFTAVLPEGQPLARHVRLAQQGTFLVKPESNGWAPFTAVQDFRVVPAAFVWDARIRMGHGLTVRVRDSFVDGMGSMFGAAMAVVTVVRMENTPDMAVAALMRYLAEACWFPTALLPSQGVRWEGIDASRARATLTDGPTTVWSEFRFGPDGLVTSIYTPARPRTVGTAVVPTAWQGRWTAWAVRNGMRVPSAGEAEWLLPDGPLVYWRGRIRRISYDWAPGS